MAGLVYVEAASGKDAVRIGRTVDLSQRLRWMDHRFPELQVEVILVGNCIEWEDAPKRAEARIFQLLDDIHLSRHNPLLYGQLPTYDWYLPDRQRIRDAFRSLCGADFPLFTGVEEMPLFERFTKLYLDYGTQKQILHVLDED